MSGRNYAPPNTFTLRNGERHPLAIVDPRVIHRLPPPDARRLLPAAVLEDHIADQHHQIQALLLENQRFATTHVSLKRHLAEVQQDLEHLTASASTIKAECDVKVRHVYENSIRTNAEIRGIEGVSSELAQVKEDIQRMSVDSEELCAKLKAVEDELAKVQPELKQVKEIKTGIDTLRKEVKKGRAAVEYEKKMQIINHEQSQIMEKNIKSMSSEIEKLRSEVADAENRARAVAALATPSPVYPTGYGAPSTGYGGNVYPIPNPYALQQVQPNTASGYGGGVQYNPYTYDMQKPSI